MTTTSRLPCRKLVHRIIQASFAIGACASVACVGLGDERDPSVSRIESEVGLPPNGEGAGYPFKFDGTVQVRPKVHLLFWGPKWHTDGQHANVVTKIVDTFRALPGSHYNNILTTYGVDNSVELVGYAFDERTPPTLVGIGIDEIAEKAEALDAALRAMTEFGWHTDGVNTQVIIFPQQGTSYFDLDPFPGLGFCGVHSWAKFHTFAYALVKWAADFPDCHNTDSNAEDIAWTAVHEYAEMATDPVIHLSLNPVLPPVVGDGWHTDESLLTTKTPHEISDICEEWSIQATNGNDNSRAPKYQPVYPPQHAVYPLPMQWSTNDSACISSKGQEFVSPDTITPFNHKHTVQGGILTKYLAMGADTGLLGQPALEEIRFSTGAVSHFAGQVCNGGFNVQGRSTGSGIYWERSTGATHEV